MRLRARRRNGLLEKWKICRCIITHRLRSLRCWTLGSATIRSLFSRDIRIYRWRLFCRRRWARSVPPTIPNTRKTRPTCPSPPCGTGSPLNNGENTTRSVWKKRPADSVLPSAIRLDVRERGLFNVRMYVCKYYYRNRRHRSVRGCVATTWFGARAGRDPRDTRAVFVSLRPPGPPLFPVSTFSLCRISDCCLFRRKNPKMDRCNYAMTDHWVRPMCQQ